MRIETKFDVGDEVSCVALKSVYYQAIPQGYEWRCDERMTIERIAIEIRRGCLMVPIGYEGDGGVYAESNIFRDVDEAIAECKRRNAKPTTS